MSESDELRGRYQAFARNEADAASPLYAACAEAVARSTDVIRFLAALPSEKRQPNLLLAAVRHVVGVPAGPDHFIDVIRRRAEAVRSVMLERRTQTNEPGRCAVLMPVLAGLPQPLALIEVGAAAGLCLLPDRYGYRYGDVEVHPSSPAVSAYPTYTCETNDVSRIPRTLPEVSWRMGIDLNPLSPFDEADVRWLETLVWPEQGDRLRGLQGAVAVAQADPPLVLKGDLFDDLPRVTAKAPKEATLVVFHTAVLAYVQDRAVRDRFAELVKDVGATWISNEAPHVFPQIAARLAAAPPAGRFVLSVDGEPQAITGPHGQSLEWIQEPGAGGP